MDNSAEEGLPRKTIWFVYLSHFLSTWGDRMWSFGVGLFMVIISPESLRVTAIYGLSMAGAILLFGALVGDWVDRTPRLKAARTSLIIQNSSVILCALIVYGVILYKPQIKAAWADDGLLYLAYSVIIMVAGVATLASMGTNIAVQKDWIVEICRQDKNMLASMTATLRRIDLLNSLVAPIATGQIMYYASTGVGALFIAGWNLVSVFAEYILLWKVYSLVPALRVKKKKRTQETEVEVGEEMTSLNCKHDRDVPDDPTLDEGGAMPSTGEPETSTLPNNTTNDSETMAIPESDRNTKTSDPIVPKKKRGDKIPMSRNRSTESSVCTRMFSGFVILYRGWRTYMKYDVAFAGLGLAALYMTVLGFDNITVGFAYTQGINTSIMGVIMAAGAISGLVGTILYPIFHRRIGLQRTGLFSYLFEVSFLCLCVASVWAPGSPFDPFLHKTRSMTNTGPSTASSVIDNHSNESVNFDTNKTWQVNLTSFSAENLKSNLSSASSNSSELVRLDIQTSAGDNEEYQTFSENKSTHSTDNYKFSKNSSSTLNSESSSKSSDNNSTVVGRLITTDGRYSSYISISLLMAGIIGARCGLWMADLTITQLFLESIKQNERGIVNGVQTSLNKLMDILKFVLVIGIPQEELFGYLVLVSFAFICLGWLLYAIYSHGARGHLFHLEKLKCATGCGVGETGVSNGGQGQPPTAAMA